MPRLLAGRTVEEKLKLNHVIDKRRRRRAELREGSRNAA